jgi:hypothetical protein
MLGAVNQTQTPPRREQSRPDVPNGPERGAQTSRCASGSGSGSADRARASSRAHNHVWLAHKRGPLGFVRAREPNAQFLKHRDALIMLSIMPRYAQQPPRRAAHEWPAIRRTRAGAAEEGAEWLASGPEARQSDEVHELREAANGSPHTLPS